MNREIKFRAWSKIRKAWLFDSDYSVLMIDLDGNLYKVQTDSCETPYRDIDDFILCQYTGLQDKNGKDIYEGDIVYCHEYDSSDCGQRIVQTFKNAVVGFGQGNYYYYPKGNMQQPHQLLMYAYKPEIIGNIYENSDLLQPNETIKSK